MTSATDRVWTRPSLPSARAAALPLDGDLSARFRVFATLRRPPVLMLIGLLAAFALLRLAYHPFDYRTVMGDDLDLLVQSRSPGGYANNFWDGFTQTTANKYRPAVTPLLALATDLFNGDYQRYVALNQVLLAMNVLLIGVIAYRLSGRSAIIAALVGLAALSSRFASYFVLQGFGIMESTALMWVLGCLLLVCVAYERSSWRLLAGANAAFLVATFAHERYLVLAAFLFSAALLAPWGMRQGMRAALTVLPLGLALLNYAVKTYLVDVEFFTGGGGQAATLEPFTTVQFLVTGLLNTVGYNVGPSYLSGQNALELGVQGVLVATALALPLLVLLLNHLVTGVQSWRQLRPVLLGACLFGPLLLSASITFRQEYRWLYAPFVILLLGVAWLAGQLPARAKLALLPVVALCGSLVVDGYYRPALPATYYFAGQKAADSVASTVIAAHRDALSTSTIVFVTHGDQAFQNWYLRNGDFFDVYAPGAHGPIVFVPELAQLPPDVAQSRDRLTFELVGGDHVRELPAAAVAAGSPAG